MCVFILPIHVSQMDFTTTSMNAKKLSWVLEHLDNCRLQPI